MSKFATVLAVALFGGTMAFAQSDAFTAADTNADGAVDFTEAQTVIADLTQEAFDAADADASGTLSAEEFATLGA